MSFLFKAKPKTAAELVRLTKEAILKLDTTHGENKKVWIKRQNIKITRTSIDILDKRRDFQEFGSNEEYFIW